MTDAQSWQVALPYLIVALIFGYLLGSVPFGYVITRWAGLGDVRKIGSGNTGATNVLRTGRKGLAAGTLLLDALKGTVAMVIAFAYGPELALAAGFGAFVGHLFPVWLGFRGGKGVATYLGILLGAAIVFGAWQGFVAFAVVWLAVAFLTRYSSLAALVAVVVVPLLFLAMGLTGIAATVALMSVIVFVKHRANISRLLSGSESRIGAKG